MIAFSSAIVLLLNIWGAQRTGMRVEPAGTMSDVENCLAVLRSFKPQYVKFRGCRIIS
jgi:hypothetical protein